MFLYKGDLPDLSAWNQGDEIPEDTLRDYAQSTWCDVDYVRRRKPGARSYVGIPIVVRGRNWGVVVIDSASPKPKNGSDDERIYGAIQLVLGKLLEKQR